MEIPYKESRNRANMKAEEAAKALHIDKRTLFRIEAGEQQATPELVWNMAKLYNDPDVLRWHRSQIDPIGRRIDPPHLNGIVNSPQSVFGKLAEELEEAAPAATQLFRFLLNKMTSLDFTELELRQFYLMYYQCVTDVKQVLAEAEEALMRMFGVEAAEEANRAHKDKMLQKGYLLTKEKALSGLQVNLSYKSLSL